MYKAHFKYMLQNVNSWCENWGIFKASKKRRSARTATLSVGEEDLIGIIVSVTNTKMDAHQAYFNLTFPETVAYDGYEFPDDQDGKSIKCSEKSIEGNNSTIKERLFY